VPAVLREQTRYKPIRVIGQGSYGQVWLAKDSHSLGALVAIKVYMNATHSLKVAKAVATELSILRQLSKTRNPRIAHATDFLALDRQDQKSAELCAVVMEYLPYTLEDILRLRDEGKCLASKRADSLI
jgi:serine/threonine protein kinase